MAELFGAVAGAISLAALFNNCVDSFEYIQLGRHFGQDFGRYQLKLDVAKLRLSRWGQSVGINGNPQLAPGLANDNSYQHACAILEEIDLLFQTIQKSSRRYEIGAKQDDLALFEDKDMGPLFKKLHGKLGAVAKQRQKQTSFMKKARWALYENKQFDKLLEQVSGFVEDLEKLFPTEPQRRQLVELEIEEVDDEPSLLALQDAANDTDGIMSAAVAQKVEAIGGRNYAKDIRAGENSRVRVGNEWAESFMNRSTTMSDRTANATDSIVASGAAGVHIGNSYGGRGTFG